MGYIERSGRIFDEGQEDEAPRLATTIRVLVHDTSSSNSLLNQLGIKNSLQYIHTALDRDRLDASHDRIAIEVGGPGCVSLSKSAGEAGLVILGRDQRGLPRWLAPLGTPRYPKFYEPALTLPFDEWWERPAIEASDFKAFSRKQLVLVMANQDGGAHVDEQVDADYQDLCVDFLGVHFGPGTLKDLVLPAPMFSASGNVAAASVRQVAFELLLTLQRHLGLVPAKFKGPVLFSHLDGIMSTMLIGQPAK